MNGAEGTQRFRGVGLDGLRPLPPIAKPEKMKDPFANSKLMHFRMAKHKENLLKKIMWVFLQEQQIIQKQVFQEQQVFIWYIPMWLKFQKEEKLIQCKERCDVHSIIEETLGHETQDALDSFVANAK